MGEWYNGPQLTVDNDSVKACFSDGRHGRSNVLVLGKLFALFTFRLRRTQAWSDLPIWGGGGEL